MKVVSLSVKYGRTVQVDGAYTSRSAESLIGYAFEEGEETPEGVAFARAESAAIASVNRLLTSNGSQPSAAEYVSHVTTKPTPTINVEPAAPAKVDKRTKAGKAGKAAAATDPSAIQNISTGNERIDPAQIEATKPIPAGGNTSLSMEDVSAAIDFNEPIVPAKPATKVFTDDDMDRACQSKMQAFVKGGIAVGIASTKVRSLISTFNPDPQKPFGMKQIPAEKRGDFLAELEGLT